MKIHDRSLPGRRASVFEDWHAWMPDRKNHVFQAHIQQLEAAYTMLSVTLDEAMELDRGGRRDKSRQAVCVTPELFSRLSEPLAALVRSLMEHAKHYGTIPNAAPLNTANFQSPRGQRLARMSSLLSHVLLSHRSQFLHKLGTLGEMVEDLQRDFGEAASDFADAALTNVGAIWERLDACHFDLNTCFRETTVLLKSFLVAIPENELEGFEQTYRVQMRVARPSQPERTRLLRPRRMVHIAGE